MRGSLILGSNKRSCLAVTLLLCIVAGTSVATDRAPTGGQPISALAEARSALTAGDSAQAIRILSSHVQAYPKSASARLLLAEAYLAAKQDRQAEEQYQAILQFAPHSYLALAGLGEIYERAGDLEKAERMLEKAAELSLRKPEIQTAWAAVLARLHRYSNASHALTGIPPPSSREERLSFYRLKASVAAGLGDSAQAASAMEKALALSPDEAGLQMATAVAEMQARHPQRAATLASPLFARTRNADLGLVLLEAQLGANQEIRPTLDLLRNIDLPEPQETLLRQRSAEILIAHDRFVEATDELNRAVELEPTRADLTFNLALAQFHAGRLDDALASAKTSQRVAETADVEDLLGDIQEARGDNLGAVRSYQAAIALAPKEAKYRLSLALDLIRHQSFEPARIVLKQAEELHPESWRIQLALGMVEYFAGSAEDATKTLLRATDLASEPEPALRYLGEVQMDQAAAPSPAAITRLCDYGDNHFNTGRIQFYCAALLFRRAYNVNDRSGSGDILRRLHAAAKALPNEASPHCQLGKAYRWIEDWQEALRESEACARMDPNSADGHYRLAQIYEHLGQQQRFEQEIKAYEAASSRQADENARRDETIKTFVYSIQNAPLDQK
jgi:tetratricopeptide (TPR) repeat protein